ncbi:hypothetical protein ACNKXS_13705 [Christiangramia marina]|uniref:hypothetical protein n=1 Tax=Christiangramia marina TaxID=409436 RepID=UPI003AA9563A
MRSKAIYLSLFCLIFSITSCDPEPLPLNDDSQTQLNEFEAYSDTGNEHNEVDDDKSN